MTDPLDPEAGDHEYPYCEAMPGMEPHNYQPYLDILKGGTYLYCNQCGDVVEMLDPPATPPQQGSTTTPVTTQPSSAAPNKPSWP